MELEDAADHPVQALPEPLVHTVTLVRPNPGPAVLQTDLAVPLIDPPVPHITDLVVLQCVRSLNGRLGGEKPRGLVVGNLCKGQIWSSSGVCH